MAVMAWNAAVISSDAKRVNVRLARLECLSMMTPAEVKASTFSGMIWPNSA
jgi:hypothetical protein